MTPSPPDHKQEALNAAPKGKSERGHRAQRQRERQNQEVGAHFPTAPSAGGWSSHPQPPPCMQGAEHRV